MCYLLQVINLKYFFRFPMVTQIRTLVVMKLM